MTRAAVSASRAHLSAAMGEQQLSDAIVTLGHTLGYLVAHFRPAQTKQGWRTAVAYDGAGWPDLVLVGNHRVLYRELKSDVGKLSEAQEAWIERLGANGADAGVWRPSDWLSGAIERELKA